MLIEIEERHTKRPILETINFVKELNYECYYLLNDNLINIDKIDTNNTGNNFIFLPKKNENNFLSLSKKLVFTFA